MDGIFLCFEGNGQSTIGRIFERLLHALQRSIGRFIAKTLQERLERRYTDCILWRAG